MSWHEHKFLCSTARRQTEEAVVEHQAGGGRRQNSNEHNCDMQSGFTSVYGLLNEVSIMAWRNRSVTPVLHVTRSPTNLITVAITPRSIWEEDPYFQDLREALRLTFDGASFRQDDHYVTVYTTERQGMPDNAVRYSGSFDKIPIRGIEIVEALTAATRAEDLADAIAWFDNKYPLKQPTTLQWVRGRSATQSDDITTTHGSVIPVPSRALNTEVAWLLASDIGIEFDIRLTGLNGNTLNGKEGSVRHQCLMDIEWWEVQLDDGKTVMVKSENFVHIPRGEYRRRKEAPRKPLYCLCT